MDARHPLSSIFLERLRDQAHGAEGSEELERAIVALWEAGAAAWPGVELSRQVFARHLGEHAEGPSPIESLNGLSGEELYLACACAQMSSAALKAFERSYLSHTPSFLSRMSPTPSLIDDVKQALREKLFLGKDGEPPKIAGYSGRGSLLTWTRVVAARLALNMKRGKNQQAETGESAIDAVAAVGGDAELDVLQSRYQEEFHKAVKEAFASLTSKQRNILRLHFVNGLSGEKIGAVFRVHQTTVARWLAAAREDVLTTTKSLLRQRLKVRDEELDSIVRGLQSRLDLSMTALLKQTQY